MKSSVKDFMPLRPHLTLSAICIDWLIIFATVYIAHYCRSLYISLLAMIIIGSRQHALAVLSHDFVHYSVLKNKRFSDYIANLFTAWPLFFRISAFRTQHLLHHRHLNTEKDPDLTRRYYLKQWHFPKSYFSIYLLLLMDLLGLNFHQNFQKLYILHRNKKKDKKSFGQDSLIMLSTQIIYYLCILSIFFYTNSWSPFLLYWILPFFTYHKFIKRIRAISEHFAIPINDYKEQTRTIILNPVESFLICPRNVNYHLEHHLYPSVPWYNLKKLSKVEEGNIRIQKDGHYTRGIFTGLVREMNAKNSYSIID